MAADVIRLRYPASCAQCGTALPAGSRARWDRVERTATCLRCLAASPEGDSDPFAGPNIRTGAAGASAAREHARRLQDREKRIRQRFPMIGSLLVAITKPSPSTRAWGTGARGEQRLGALLDALPQTWVLHDRAIPGSRANIDHIVVASSGVWVIDTKNYRGKVERRGGGLLSAGNAQLFVNGRNRTPLTRGVTAQVAAVRTPLASDIRVEGVLCFVGGDWPTGGCPFRVEGVHVHGPRSLKAAISRSGPLGIRDREVIAASLSRTFPPAG